jgi:hypothetical protein
MFISVTLIFSVVGSGFIYSKLGQPKMNAQEIIESSVFRIKHTGSFYDAAYYVVLELPDGELVDMRLQVPTVVGSKVCLQAYRERENNKVVRYEIYSPVGCPAPNQLNKAPASQAGTH